MAHGPDWTEGTVRITTEQGSEDFTIYKRCPVAVVRYLIGLARLRDHICYGPERHSTVTRDGRWIRVYSEMWTGEWWWRMQVRFSVNGAS